MVTVCWAAKGGSGTTVVATTLALTQRPHTLLVDLGGDVPAALGLAEPTSPGVGEWLLSDAPAARLSSLEVAVAPGLAVLPSGSRRTAARPERWEALAAWLAQQDRAVVVDAGTSPPPTVLQAADRRLLVTRPCYLSLRAAVVGPHRPTGVVVVREPGRSLSDGDIGRALGVPVVASVLLDPAVARAVDAGLLASRLPAAYRTALTRARQHAGEVTPGMARAA